MNSYLKESWTEEEILALPDGEHNYFDRKASNFLSDTDFPKDLAKALSAFANSGGGHIVIGENEDRTIDGVDKIYRGKKGTSTQETREWLEIIIPNLLNYPLQEFRVHAVNISSLSKDKVVIVIDVGDSKLAPHQTNLKGDIKLYYQRFGGHSVPAEHHNISLMFGRSRFPSKEVAESWLHNVINPLIDYLKGEGKNLEQKKRVWERREYPYYLISSFPSIKLLLDSNSKICDLDILEQFFEFNFNIEDMLIKHDELIQLINKQLGELYNELIKLPFIDYFRNITSPENLLKIYSDDFELKKLKPEELYSQTFSSEATEEDNLDFIATLVINRIRIWDGRRAFNIFWQKESENFISFLQHPYLSSFDQAINESYEDCLLLNLEITRLLKDGRRNLSIEHGIPVR